ncbi:hypothetical protein MMC07_000902 [Pseudocyphellaria aurata]|nr:hypothetical protein [Pseudocyphellaria aurata]
MASLRRNKNMATDGATPKFLYTILKQLDLKSVDWNEVAENLGITNGHAARMRFSRFKQQMEGVAPSPRKPRSAVAHDKKPKREKAKPKREVEPKENSQPLVKPEVRGDIEEMAEHPVIHPAALVKDEPIEEEYDPHLGHPEWTESHGHPQQDFLVPYQEDEVHYSYPEPPQVEREPNVKIEPDLAS